MAVENDYNLLVANLSYLADNTTKIETEVKQRLLEEKREGLEPNETAWVNMLAQRLTLIESQVFHLKDGASRVLRSRPGEAVFPDRPPAPPDFP